MDDYYQEQDSQLTDVDSDDEEDEVDNAEDLNHDTITSLRNLMQTSKLFVALQQQQAQQQQQQQPPQTPNNISKQVHVKVRRNKSKW